MKKFGVPNLIPNAPWRIDARFTIVYYDDSNRVMATVVGVNTTYIGDS